MKISTRILAAIAIIICLLSGFGCGGGLKHHGAGTQIVNIVLCDLTRSLDTTSIDSIASHAGLLLSHAANHSDWYFYGIGESDYNERLCEYTSRTAQRTTALNDSIYQAKVQCTTDKLQKDILHLYQTNNYQRTCITFALKTAYDKIKERKKQNDSLAFNVIILSDLIEDCSHPVLGEIRFTDAANFQSSLNTLNSRDTTLFNLKSVGAKVYIVAESRNKHIKGMSLTAIEDAWRVIMTRYGYSKQDDALQFSWLSLPEAFSRAN